MPIEAACGHCGKAFKVSSKFAGKKAKCTDCGNTFSIPAPASAAASTPSQYENNMMAGLSDAAAREGQASATAAPPRMPQVASGSKCPSCNQLMDVAAVVCVNCGYNRKTNKTMKVQVEKGATGEPKLGGVGGLKLSFAGPWIGFISTNILVCILGMALFSFAGIVHPGVSKAWIGWSVGFGLVSALAGVIFIAPVIKASIGGRAWVFVFLLCAVPTGLILGGWGYFVKRTMTYQAIAGAHLDQHLNEYLKEGGGQVTNGGYLVGKVVVIDMGSKDFSDLQFELPASLAPKDASEVGTAVHVNSYQKTYGKYDNGATAFQWVVDIRAYDIHKNTLIAGSTIMGGPPPQTTKQTVSDSGSKPEKEIIQSIQSLPVKPL